MRGATKTWVCLILFACALASADLARSATQTGAGSPPAITEALVQRGRVAVVTHACGECHGGMDNPAADGWLRWKNSCWRSGPRCGSNRRRSRDIAWFRRG